MKIYWMLIMALLQTTPYSAAAQLLGGFFNQKGAQRKLLLEQIAAFRAYKGYLQKGYKVVKDGSRLIGDIRSGEFGLHKNYFTDLNAVNPAIAGSDKVAAIKRMQNNMARMRLELFTLTSRSAVVTAKERAAIKSTLEEYSRKAAMELDELLLAIEPGRAELSDDARIHKVDQVYKSIQKNYGLHIRIGNSLRSLIGSRTAAAASQGALRRWHALPLK